MKIALWQMQASGDPAANLSAMLAGMAEAAAAGARLAVFPEYSMVWQAGGSDRIIAAAEPLDGPYTAALRAEAARLGLPVIINLFERNEATGRPYNTLVAIDEAGEIAGLYRKVHLYNAFGYREDDSFTAGPDTAGTVVELAGLRIGLQICYDLRFPEGARSVVDAGAELIVYPAAWVPGPMKEAHWAALLQARAIENTAYVAGAGMLYPAGSGGTRLVDPMGATQGDLGEQAGMLLAELDPERVRSVRAKNPSLDNRRFAVVPRG
ncbi:carbon-nitrogen hydrolase family protein [Leucobacter sp. M11]|uniref:carbon-nitrogen hydrolase family protein n=1 Tax=Leucobacter sp. M11 TaxID=2993565 RepID=UPI002D7E9F4D|nr:carbon-nitrogen hydrolase family protein [Leucobacter sp. M11]MEB4614986.1 carbon-nitrogen hydrolase family protein [Leucobacter sp. M11]